MELSLLEKFADPSIFQTLSFGEKMEASLMVTALGMLITFTVLMLLWGLIGIMSRLVASIESRGKTAVESVQESQAGPSVVETVPPVSEDDAEELIAVISAAVAASLDTSIHNIVVKNIVRVEDPTPAWGKSGRIEQMNTRF